MILYTLFSFLFALEVCQSAVLKQNVKNSPASIDPIVEWGLKELFSSRRYRRSILSTNPNINQIASQTTSYIGTRRLYGKTGVLLQITSDGTVSGSVDCTSEYTKLEVHSVGKGMKRIKGIKTGRFVAINANGDLYSTTTPSDETIFKEAQSSSTYNTYASAKYYITSHYDAFISIGRNGVARNASGTLMSQNKVKFLLVSGCSASSN
ncbi:fibroblast growth factor 1-like [Porites lutea]|uniref:fibroblast growth factor 1-like n=1 Tax=Porites lutea TaxID=51062 RepID=UPI003CC6D096